ncbi:MAG TPA: aromatic ring-hydroxylating dioxygenase subunit alpha [Candidatus Deferrimicrobiaceae bacterium]|nr:aromatic ring-hydroxylating dioxygenase subunit alpha [Candidatus Deferrimicrobiaceae bacterium]
MIVEPVRMARAAMEPSLPKAAYVAEDFFERERDGIFFREWFCVGRAETLRAAGDYLHVDVAGERILVVRTRAGDLRAHYDVCRHRGSRLVLDPPAPASADAPEPSGHFKGVIRCPYHSWCYELDGRVRNAPFLGERDDFEPEAFGLHPVELGAWGGWLFVRLARPDRASSPTLADQLGAVPERLRRYPLEELRVARRIVYDVAANWKVVLENYNECYHCAGVHPELCKIVPAFKRRGGSELDWDAGVPQADGTFTFTFNGRTDRAPFPGLSPEEQERHKGELVYPNLMVSLSADHVAAFTLLPRAPDRTTIVCDWLFHPSEIAKPTFDPSDAVDFWDLVNRQDWVICEATQSGMTSRAFDVGWYAPMEDMSLDIRRYVRERAGDP